MTTKRIFLFLLLIIFIALFFRLPAILNSGSFWFDEIVSLEIAKHSIINSWHYLKWENNPPLHYWFLHYWLDFFNLSEISLRLSSLLFSLLGLIAMYFLGKKLFNPHVGLIASFLLAVSSSQLFLSMDARMYPMLLFFSLLSCYFFWSVLKQPNKKNWFFYILFSLLSFYTHLTGFFLFIIQNLYIIYYYNFVIKRQLKLFHWIISQLIIFILFFPWLINFIIRSVSTMNSGAWYLHTTGQGFLLLQIPRSFLFFGDKNPFIELIGLMFFGSLFILSFAKIYNWSLVNKEFKIKLNIPPALVFIFILFVIPLAFGFLIQMWVAKYYLISLIGFLVILAVGFDNLKLSKNIKIILLFIILIFTTPYNLNVMRVNHHTWREVAQYVEQIAQPNDIILISAFVYQLPFEHYYTGKNKVIAYQPKNIEQDKLLKAVKYNWQPLLTKNNMPAMQQFIGNKKRIIIVNPSVVESIHKSNLVINWFVDHNWHLINKKEFGGFIRPTVLIFVAPLSQ